MKKIALILAFVLLFPILSLAQSPKDGLCEFYHEAVNNDKSYGCIKTDSVEECKEMCFAGGVEFEKFIMVDDVSNYKCYNSSAVRIFKESVLSRLTSDQFSFPLRVVLNHPYHRKAYESTLFKNNYYPFLISFLVSFLLILFIRFKFFYIPGSFMVLFVLICSDIVLTLTDLNASYQLYVKIFSSVYSLVSIYHLITVITALLIMIFFPIYFYIQFRRGVIPKSMARFINFIDKIKSKLTPE